MRLSAMGDILWTLPMLRRLQQAFPEAHITYFIGKPFRQLLDGFEGITVHPLSKPHSLQDYIKLKEELSSYDFDLLLCTQANLRVNLLYPLIKSKRKLGFDNQRGRDFHRIFVKEKIPFRKEHSLEAFLGFTDYLKISSSDINYKIQAQKQDIEDARELIPFKNFLVLHPRASSLQRSWKLESYSKLVKLIQKSMDIAIVLTGVKEDLEFTDKIQKQAPNFILNLCGKTTINQLKGVFSLAELIIAPDSGPIHLANALGKKVLGLYAALPTSYTGPYQQSHHCIDVYEKAVKKFLKIDPQRVSWRKRVHHANLMDLISVQEVFRKIENFIAQKTQEQTEPEA